MSEATIIHHIATKLRDPTESDSGSSIYLPMEIRFPSSPDTERKRQAFLMNSNCDTSKRNMPMKRHWHPAKNQYANP